ncbi:MAG TPA: methyltransferase domain-containing protein [Methanobacteriaceae archaeon]|nr:methyltransferase domain-containing protein [Methanobacteriaceae archaeon]
MNITPYHHNLLSDHERLVGFFEAIKEKSKGIVYDLGTGSGILASVAAPHADHVFAVENNPKTAQIATRNLSNFDNVSVLVEDATKIVFPEKADLIICEMIDTGLIDEELIPVLQNAVEYLKDDGEIIPCGIFNGLEPIHMENSHICYQNDLKNNFIPLGPLKIYNSFELKKKINEKVDVTLKPVINCNGTVNGIKITTFTILTSKLICGPTPMLNPPLLIPTNPLKVSKGEKIDLNLKYVMGGGLNTIKARIS